MTIQEQIKQAAIHADISITELAKRFGISQPGFSQRMKNGKFTRQELEKIANILNCEYVSYFKFDDGYKY